MFHKNKKKLSLIFSQFEFKIKSILVNRDAKVIQKTKKQYDVRIEYCALQIFGAKIFRLTKQTTKFHKNHNQATTKYINSKSFLWPLDCGFYEFQLGVQLDR